MLIYYNLILKYIKKKMLGGHSDAQDVDDEHREELLSFKTTVEAKSGKTYEMFEAVKFTK